MATPPPPHIIQKQTIRLQVSGQAVGWELQRQTEELLQSRPLLQALDEVLTDLSPADEWVEVERVEIDLGHLEEGLFTQQLPERLPQALRRQLADAVPAASLKGETVVKSAGQNLLEALCYFLQTGVLPPHFLPPDQWEIWEGQVRALLNTLSPLQKETLRKTLEHPVSRLRLIRQFQTETIRSVFDLLAPSEPSIPQGLLQPLLPLQTIAPDLYERVLEVVLQKMVQGRLPEIASLIERLPNADQKTRNPQDLRQVVQDFLAETGLSAERKETGGAPEEEVQQQAISESAQEEPVFFLRNAGVVLLNPFLPTCFAACGWLQKDGFKSEKSRHKALLLLHFLATGQAAAPEYDLLLPKLLCGAPANAPLPFQVKLSKKEQAEGNTLLRAAITHWAALRNTSPDGLREAFLQREGKLEPLPSGHWALTVEQKSQDLLLNRLPYGWGLGLVQLPWMKQPLTINWV